MAKQFPVEEKATVVKPKIVTKKKAQNKIHLYCWLFVLPNLILFLLFQGWPIVVSWYYAMTNWSGLGSNLEFIGLANFKELVNDPFFWNAYRNIFIYSIGSVPLQLTIGLIFATILNNPKLKFASIYRTMIFLPVVTSAAIIGIIMGFIWSPDGGVNFILTELGIVTNAIDFLGSMSWAMPTVIMVSVWMSVGINMIFWLAGLQGIPRELYEAAYIDGASHLKTFFSVTVPLLIPVGAVILLFNVAFSLRAFDLIMTLTGGGPFFATDVVATYIYGAAFSGSIGQPRMGYGAAAGIFFGFTVIFIMGGTQYLKAKMSAKRNA